jgi:hypothetical protein
MGLNETEHLRQVRKNQEAERAILERLVTEQQATNALLRQLIAAVETAGGLPPYRGTPASGSRPDGG